ncbi:hypothetical protein [Photobacterium nomapromontoriensis]|uniref:hypothetical protein n=1 Tax=Photobacterium nomapromontoriensis TaxID=2910237 RepID=UPI003D117FE5
MKNSAVVSIWGVDAFGCLINSLFDTISVEQISRVESFISAFILYERVHINDKFKHHDYIAKLNLCSDNAIEFIGKSKLNNSDDMKDHLSFDMALYDEAFDDLAEENDIWLFHNDPDIGKEIFTYGLEYPEIKAILDSKSFTQLRLWMWCLTNEMAEITESVCVLPISMNSIADYSIKRNNQTEYLLDKYRDYEIFHNAKMLSLTESSEDRFWAELAYIPPFLLLFLDRCSKGNDPISALISLREDYAEFRNLRHRYMVSLNNSKTISERIDIVDDWNNSWKLLSAGEFKKPQFLKNRLSSTDISSVLMSLESAAPKTLIRNFLDYSKYKKSYTIFRAFGDLHMDIGNLSSEKALLKSTFGVDDIAPLKKI